MNNLSIFLLVITIFLSIVSLSWQLTPEDRRQAHISEQLAKTIPENTKRMVNAMDAQGIPKKAIAERIRHAAGGNQKHAERLVEAIKSEGARKSKK